MSIDRNGFSDLNEGESVHPFQLIPKHSPDTCRFLSRVTHCLRKNHQRQCVLAITLTMMTHVYKMTIPLIHSPRIKLRQRAGWTLTKPIEKALFQCGQQGTGILVPDTEDLSSFYSSDSMNTGT